MIDFPRAREKRPGASFDFIRVKLASPSEIRGWSHGEVLKPETINYRSYKPEHDALFCERIFGPSRDWECHCGQFKRIRFRGRVCDRCGVEVTHSRVRRERMGHIELAVPIVHLWFFKALPSPLGNLLGMTLKDLERVIYYSDYVVTNPGRQKVPYMTLLDDDELYDLRAEASLKGDNDFKAESGAEAVRALLAKLDSPKRTFRLRNSDGKGIDRLAKWLREEIRTETSQHRRRKKLKRLKMVEAIRNSGPTPDQRNKPEWMVMEVIPVIPPDLRPLVPLDGGRFATSDLNDLYRRVINRNNRLKKLMDMSAPEVILRNEKRMLQESVDALFDNGRRGKAIKGRGARPLKSLSDMLKGKQGRFRQNLLGKRVDYSGRSVIVVGPELKLHQCGLPKTMAVELFKPFIIHELERRGEAETVKRAKKIVEDGHPKVYEALEDIIRDHPVLLNRAPTLHRLSIQAFEPVLVEGKAIRLHPLVCAAFNADFDGDQMAVHVPLSYEAQVEARVLMLSSNNLLLPANGRPITTPSQDMVIGCYYLTNPGKRIADLEGAGGRVVSESGPEAGHAPVRFGEGSRAVEAVPSELKTLYADVPRFSSYAEVEMALAHGRVRHGSPIWYLFTPVAEHDPDGVRTWYMTTVGRVLFNAIVPDELGYQNRTFGKKQLANLIFDVLRHPGTTMERTTAFLDDLKDLGFRYATVGGVSIGITDLAVPEEKDKIISEATERVARFQKAYEMGFISDGERYNKVIDTWTHANNDLAEQMTLHHETSRDGFNPVHMMMTSGARGNLDQMRQLAGMRGLMAKPQKKLTGAMGEIIESPIRSNFREGLTVVEYFLSTHGARKGLADTALKTADAGYLTRRLVDVAQDVTITEYDCGTFEGVEVAAYKDGEKVVDSLADRITGSVIAGDTSPERADAYAVIDPFSGDVLLRPGDVVGKEQARRVEERGIEKVTVRSVLTCRSKKGLCCLCYGRNMATMEIIDEGEAVGIVAAQSIGEPGTQLTLRTFHIGGAAGRIAEQSDQDAKQPGTVRLYNVKFPPGSENQAERVVVSREGELLVTSLSAEIDVPKDSLIAVADGSPVAPGGTIYRVKAGVAGRVRRVEDGVNEAVRILGSNGELLREIPVPKGTRPGLDIKDGVAVDPETTIDICHRETKRAVVFYRGLETVDAPGSDDRRVTGESGGIRVELREVSHPLPYGASLKVRHGQEVLLGQRLYTWDPYHRPFIAEKGGMLKLFQVEEGKTFRIELDAATGRRQRTIIRHRPPTREETVKHPVIYVTGDGAPVGELEIPAGAELLAEDGQEVEAGHRVGRVWGARAAGTTSFMNLKEASPLGPGGPRIALNRSRTKGREAHVLVYPRTGDDGAAEPVKHFVPEGAELLVEDGREVREGERLYEWDPENAPLVAAGPGVVRLENVLDSESRNGQPRVEGEELVIDRTTRVSAVARTVGSAADESQPEGRSRSLSPKVLVVDEDTGRSLNEYTLRTGDRLLVQQGDFVAAGRILAHTRNERRRAHRSPLAAVVAIEGKVELVPTPGEVGRFTAVGVESGAGIRLTTTEDDSETEEYLPLSTGAIVRVRTGQEVRRNETLFETDPYAPPVVAPVGGVLDFDHDGAGRVAIREKLAELHPQDRSQLESRVEDRARIEAGDTLARFPREEYKTRDITGGLPRVTELFEGRRPKDPAVISRIDGRVEFGEIKRAKREVLVRPEYGEPETYLIPVGKHLRVQQGDWVREGDRLSEGSIDPHDLLTLSDGRRRVQEYILREVLDVYRLQGVRINEKHIAVIVRQMLRRVKVKDPRDTELLEGDTYDMLHVQEVNAQVLERARAEGRKPKPAVTEPLLLGITKAALTTDSFVSSASFQETTRVLTDASLKGASDGLKGLKENIIIGQLVPAGTGIYRSWQPDFTVSGEFWDEEIEPLFSDEHASPLDLAGLRLAGAGRDAARAAEVRVLRQEETGVLEVGAEEDEAQG